MDGRPSSGDFLTIDLLPIVDTFAERWDELPPAFEGQPDYRMVISAGVLVRAFVVDGHLGDDDVIELISINLDPWD